MNGDLYNTLSTASQVQSGRRDSDQRRDDSKHPSGLSARRPAATLKSRAERWLWKFLRLFSALALAAAPIASPAETVTDRYALTMYLQVPRIYDNTASLGYRKYQSQRLAGELTITYDTTGESRPVVAVTSLTNRTHKINGEPITYDCTVDEYQVTPRVNLIGNNRTGVFNTASTVFYLNAEPSYALESGEDNSLLVTVAGRGQTSVRDGKRVITMLYGSVAGTLGCGCKAYGHVSPTRVAGPDGATGEVDDVASVFGSWRARWRGRTNQ